MVPNEVKRKLFEAYLRDCRILYHIAYFQWRSMNSYRPSELYGSRKESEKIATARIQLMESQNNDNSKVGDVSTPKDQVGLDFLEKYNMDEEFEFNVNSFESIKWPDPFPDQNTTFEINYK